MKLPDDILLDATNSYLSHSSCSQAKFIHDLLMPALVEQGIETAGEYTTAEEYDKWRSTQTKAINTMLNHNRHVPVRWLKVWLDVLPDPYCSEARSELMATLGVVDVQLPSLGDDGGTRADLAGILRQVADMMEAGAVPAADGRYDQKDSTADLIRLANELTEGVSGMLREIVAISHAADLSETPAGIVLQKLK